MSDENEKKIGLIKKLGCFAFGIHQILYLIVAIYYTIAIFAGLQNWLGLWAIIALPLSLICGLSPIIGTTLAIAGAITTWGWSFWFSVLMFIVAPVGFMLLGVGFMLLGRLISNKE